MKTKIPTKVQCYQMISKMKMMDHIVVHSLQVCRVATFLTEHLNKQHYRLNFDLIQSAALLHDITKTRSFKTREDHALTGGEYLSESSWINIRLPQPFGKWKSSIMPISGFYMMKSSSLTSAWTISWKDMRRHLT